MMTGSFLLDRFSGRPDVEIQAVLALGVSILKLGDKLPVDSCLATAVLEADGLVRLCISCAIAGSLDGWYEAQRPRWWEPVGDAEPLIHIRGSCVDETGVRAAGCLNLEVIVLGLRLDGQ